MEKALVFIILSSVAALQENDPASNQLVDFKNKTKGPIGVLTTGAGAPIDKNSATSSLNTNLITNEYLMETLVRVSQERVPERVGHGKGTGAFGYFEATRDISHICKAKLFSKVGKKTPVVVRFSTSTTGLGGIDTNREGRGMGVRFYTEEGNLDLVCFNTPIIFSKDPVLFPTRLTVIKRNPVTNLVDSNMIWDYLTTFPENLYTYLYILSDRGIPDGYRHMAGYAIHSYEVYNNNGTKSWMRFHFKPNAGLKNLNSTEALKIGASDRDYAVRDLYNTIAKGEFPSWDLKVQILSKQDVIEAKKNGLDVFSVSNSLPVDKYPLQSIGTLVLNRNPTNFHSDVELLALCPANMVPGMSGAPDKIFEARRLFYKDAHNYRLGVNHNNIPVNCPINSPAFTYNRDGRPPVNDNGFDMPNYYPNSFNGPEPYVDKHRPPLSKIHESKPDNFGQMTEYYLNEIASDERLRLAQNIANSLCPAADFLKERALKVFKKIHSDLEKQIKQELATKQC